MMQGLLDRLWKIKHNNADDWQVPPHIILFWEVLCCVDNERKSLPKVHRVPLRCKINSETSSIGNTFLSEY